LHSNTNIRRLAENPEGLTPQDYIFVLHLFVESRIQKTKTVAKLVEESLIIITSCEPKHKICPFHFVVILLKLVTNNLQLTL